MTGPGDLSIVDAHAHFWRWPTDDVRAEEARAAAANAPAAYSHDPISPAELLSVMDRAGVDKLIQVTRSAMGYDNSYSLEGASAHPERIRVLGRFDPRARDLEAHLDEAAADRWVVGARVHHFPPEEEWLVDGTYDRFWSGIEARGLVASVYVPNRADIIAEVAGRHDGLTVIVDHAGVSVMPDRDPAERFGGWDDVLGLARLPNVVLKVSGLPEATEETSPPFPRAAERLQQACEAFGAGRLMWGSNYPPTLRVCSYERAVAFVRDGCDFLSNADRRAVLGGTARRVLKLPW